MSILTHLNDDEKKRRIANFTATCKAVRSSTKLLGSAPRSAPQPLWDEWQDQADLLRECGLEPLDYANLEKP